MIVHGFKGPRTRRLMEEEEEKSIKKTRESTPFHYQPPLSTPTIEVRLSQSVSSTWKALRPCGTPLTASWCSRNTYSLRFGNTLNRQIYAEFSIIAYIGSKVRNHSDYFLRF